MKRDGLFWATYINAMLGAVAFWLMMIEWLLK